MMLDAGEPHIGRPMKNRRIYILDRRREPVPTGVVGEIFIGGAGVSRGYLNRPELTAERFHDDPFSSDPRARIYQTGDLGRWRADGTIEVLGRNDYQVKIRGFRIELGEIEARLMHHPEVKEAVVLAREVTSGEQRLVAYVIPGDSGGTEALLSREELRLHLEAALPSHMVPSAFIFLDRMPLTSSGKLNRRALPAPGLTDYVSRDYEGPEGEIEEALGRVWQSLLHVHRVGRQDNFFELGGHSFLVLKLLLNIKQALGVELSVADAYNNPTLRQLASRISGDGSTEELIDLAQEARLSEEIRPISGSRYVPARTVLLTGATGFVGRFLLAQLLKDTDATIYCLVRAPSAEQASSRLKMSLAKWDLWSNEFDRRVIAIPGDLSRPRLGVTEMIYETLLEPVDSIYHCATSMNHLETYSMAKPTNVDATRDLLKLATQRKPKLVNYISTLSVFGGATTDAIRVVTEESPIDGERRSSAQGYVASRWVSDKIVMTASERGIPCNIFRLGLVWADTQQGRYDELQREYRLLKSCLLSGYGIQNYRFDMPPTPVDYVARAIVYLANRHPDGKGVFHLSSRGQAIKGVFERCNEVAGTSLQLKSWFEWVAEIKRLHHEGRALSIVPLVEFAFSMNEESLENRLNRIGSGNVRFDCTRTNHELESAGISAAILNDDLLKLHLESLFLRDPEVREWSTNGTLQYERNSDTRRYSRAVGTQ
jgi:thioester reductase-like protein